MVDQKVGPRGDRRVGQKVGRSEAPRGDPKEGRWGDLTVAPKAGLEPKVGEGVASLPLLGAWVEAWGPLLPGQARVLCSRLEAERATHRRRVQPEGLGRERPLRPEQV